MNTENINVINPKSSNETNNKGEALNPDLINPKSSTETNNTEEVLNLIDSLGTYFRIGLSNGKTFITLDEELEHIDSYLRIQKARFEERLSYSIYYDDCLTDYMVIRILLQPIVENAVVHGVNKMDQDGEISIRVTSSGTDIVVLIMNNSQIPEKLVDNINNELKLDRKIDCQGFGLYSVNHRIKLEYGEKYGLQLFSKDGWTTATINIPKITRGEQSD